MGTPVTKPKVCLAVTVKWLRMATPVNETKGMSHNNHQVEMNGYACNETKVCLAVTVKWLRMATPVNETKGMSRSYSQVVKDGYAR